MSEKLPCLLLSLPIILRMYGLTEASCHLVGLTADCTNQGLTSIPQNLPTNVTRSNLQHNLITTLNQSDFSQYRSWITLDLGNNSIATVERQAFYYLSSLTFLDLLGNDLTNLLSDMFTGLGNLQTLYLDDNEISNIQAGTFNTTSQLKTLALHHNKLTNLRSDMFTGLGNLKQLFLYNNEISNIQAGTFTPTSQLTTLSLDYNNLTNLRSDMFTGLGNLTTLGLHHNQLIHLRSDTFMGLENLLTLYLYNNEISDIQAGTFNSTSHLKTLGLHHNKLTSLRSDMLMGLGNLDQLYLYNNDLSDIQAGTFSSTSQLTVLSLHNNKLTSLNSTIFKGLENLEQLYLYNNEISNIKAGTFTPTSTLRNLNLDHNKLTRLGPGMFTGFGNLQKLFLDNNEIGDIQVGTFGPTSSLRSLNLYHNRLTRIGPGMFTGLGNLQKLFLDNNEISDIQTGTFGPTSNLKSLTLYQNRLTLFKAEIFPTVSELQLQNNQIETLSSTAYDKLSSISTVYIDNNPWQCDCRMLPFRQKMMGSRAFENQIKCKGPSNFYGQNLVDINPEDLASVCTEPKIMRFGRSDNNTVVQGETLHLLCEASGIPTPDITVILPSGLNVTVESSVRVTVDVNGAITITNVTAADAGLYVCTAASHLGSTSATLSVDIQLNTVPTAVVTNTSMPPSSKELEPTSHTFSLPVLIGSVCGAVLATALLVAIVPTIWLKRRSQTPHSGSYSRVFFKNKNTGGTVILRSHDEEEEYERPYTGRGHRDNPAFDMFEEDDYEVIPPSPPPRNMPPPPGDQQCGSPAAHTADSCNPQESIYENEYEAVKDDVHYINSHVTVAGSKDAEEDVQVVVEDYDGHDYLSFTTTKKSDP
ncbi:uncharacterized protein LOC144872848 [Branchiostoma floridae x Branchiostoma japonicum]